MEKNASFVHVKYLCWEMCPRRRFLRLMETYWATIWISLEWQWRHAGKYLETLGSHWRISHSVSSVVFFGNVRRKKNWKKSCQPKRDEESREAHSPSMSLQILGIFCPNSSLRKWPRFSWHLFNLSLRSGPVRSVLDLWKFIIFNQYLRLLWATGLQ